LTFENSTLSTITIPAGTHITTNTTGQEVVTDEEAVVPPDPAMIPGVADGVRAHAVKVGQSGNIHAMDINKPCCVDGITVYNKADFTSGTDAQTAHTVQQSDIDKVVASLKTALTQKAQSDIESQAAKSGKKLVTPTVTCPADLTNVTATPGVGASAANFTVTGSLTCSDVAYSEQSAKDQLKQKLTQLLDTGFVLLDPVIEKATVDANGNTVQVSGRATELYKLTAADQSNIKNNIARKTQKEARDWLLQFKGGAGIPVITKVSTSVTGPIINLSGTDRLPDDLGAINITTTPQIGRNL
jgi:hypothetical protein